MENDPGTELLNQGDLVGSENEGRPEFAHLDPEAKRLKELKTEYARFKKLLAESMLEIEATREALQKKW